VLYSFYALAVVLTERLRLADKEEESGNANHIVWGRHFVGILLMLKYKRPGEEL